MRKSYYLVFASSKGVDDTASDIADRLSIDFEPRESSYLGGAYYKYAGYYADRLSVEPVTEDNNRALDPGATQNARGLVFVQHTTGKNADRKAKSAYLRTQLQAIEGLSLVREAVVEEP